VGCGERCAPETLVRLILAPSGEIAVDAAGGGFGRGAHVHARVACLQQAAVRGLLRATKGHADSVSVAAKEGGAVVHSEAAPFSAAALAQAIEAAMTRRISGLLATAARTHKARLGSDSASTAWRSGDAALLLVATDAAAAAELTSVREAVAAGAAVAWGTKKTLAAALFRPEKTEGIAVAAITDTRIAAAVRDAVEKTMGVRGDFGERTAPKRAAKDAPRADFQSKVQVHRAGRAPGRQLPRTHKKQAVVERSE
jgi:predicted RNA-binding protein YlxR (DUF448 family)